MFTVPYEFYLNYKLYGIMARKDRNTDTNTKKKFDIDIEKWKKKIEVHETIVNLSKIVESALESGFQFFFQSVFIVPSFILQETSKSWTQLVNWRIASIMLSFASFAMTYFTIRYHKYIAAKNS